MNPVHNCFPHCQKVLLPHLSLSSYFLWSHCKPCKEKDILLNPKSFTLIICCFHRAEVWISSDKKVYGKGVSDARGLKNLFITKESSLDPELTQQVPATCSYSRPGQARVGLSQMWKRCKELIKPRAIASFSFSLWRWEVKVQHFALCLFIFLSFVYVPSLFFKADDSSRKKGVFLLS